MIHLLTEFKQSSFTESLIRLFIPLLICKSKNQYSSTLYKTLDCLGHLLSVSNKHYMVTYVIIYFSLFLMILKISILGFRTAGWTTISVKLLLSSGKL